jgi:site-specific DNA recombinase
MKRVTHTEPTTKRAAIYPRVSSTQQEDDGTSLGTQEAACLQFATERGYSVAPEHV